MRTLVLLFTLLLAAGSVLAGSGRGSTSKRTPRSNSGVRVRGSVTKRGAHIRPHRRTAPNRTQRDNWSTKRNVNPITGKRGMRTAKR